MSSTLEELLELLGIKHHESNTHYWSIAEELMKE